MSTVETRRTGGKEISALTIGAAISAARSAWRTAQFFGTASATTKITTTSKTVATATPSAPNRRAETTPTSEAATSWQISTSSSTGWRKPSGSSTSRARVRAPRAFCSTSERARARLVRTRPVSASASSGGEADEQHEDSDNHPDDAAGGADAVAAKIMPARLARGEVRGEQLLLAPLHRLCLVVRLVVHADQVQDAVHEQQRDLVVVASGVIRSVSPRDRGADDDVAEERVGRRQPGPVPPGVRPAGLVLDREGEHVGRPLMAEELLVQRGDARGVDETERELDLPAGEELGEHGAREGLPARAVEGLVVLVVGDEDRDRHLSLRDDRSRGGPRSDACAPGPHRAPLALRE